LKEEVLVEKAHLPTGSVWNTDNMESDTSSRRARGSWRGSAGDQREYYDDISVDLLEVFSRSSVLSGRLDNDPVGQTLERTKKSK
jgi:hypothetical protein